MEVGLGFTVPAQHQAAGLSTHSVHSPAPYNPALGILGVGLREKSPGLWRRKPVRQNTCTRRLHAS
jgi:hypothetical protein